MRILFILIVSAGLAFPQLDSYSVTITASKSTVVQPDQATFDVWVYTNLTTGFDGALAAVEGAGISAANLASLSTQSTGGRVPQTNLLWFFVVSVPLTALNSTMATLGRLEQNAGAGITISFSLQGLVVSPQLQASQTCPIADLMTDARNQAQQLAALAGFNLGPAQAISDGSVGVSAQAGYSGFFVSGAILQITSFLITPSPGCTIVVRFALV